MGRVLCLFSFVFVFRHGRQSLGRGLGALLAIGYAYGILRARYPDGFSHFMFDAGTLGLYLAQFSGKGNTAALRYNCNVRLWVTALAGWPLLIFLIPYQHPLIRLVGLRAAIFFLPVVLMGARADERTLRELTGWLAALNLLAFVFAVAELALGIEAFYPLSAVTELIYRSFDIGPEGYPRIPATFINAHAYAGTMVATLPFLFSRWLAARVGSVERLFMAAAIVAAALGVFIAGARQPVVILFFEVLLVFLLRMSVRKQFGLLVLTGLVAFFVWHSERLQRFTTLNDTDIVRERIGQSINLGFFEMLDRYPLGAGLGSAVGTSFPSFLQPFAGEQIGMENEYGRIALEQTALGLIMWVAFIAWTVSRRPLVLSSHWRLGVQLMRVFVLCSWATALIGTGMLTSIPHAVLLLLQMGVLAGGGLEAVARAAADEHRTSPGDRLYLARPAR